jgi:hypothetical protein
MAMSEYNKDSPWIKILMSDEIKIAQETKLTARYYIIFLISGIILGTIMLITSIFYPDYSGRLKFILLSTIWILDFIGCLYISGASLKYLLKHSPIKEIRNILYGDTFKIQNINQEKVFNLICDDNKLIGSLGILKRVILLQLTVIALLFGYILIGRYYFIMI